MYKIKSSNTASVYCFFVSSFFFMLFLFFFFMLMTLAYRIAPAKMIISSFYIIIWSKTLTKSRFEISVWKNTKNTLDYMITISKCDDLWNGIRWKLPNNLIKSSDWSSSRAFVFSSVLSLFLFHFFLCVLFCASIVSTLDSLYKCDNIGVIQSINLAMTVCVRVWWQFILYTFSLKRAKLILKLICCGP